MSSQKLTLPSKQMLHLFSSIKPITVPAILDIVDDEMDVVASTADRSIHLWANMKGDFGVTTTLNLPSVSKLSDLIKLVGTSNVTFNLKKNKLEYRGNGVKFDYHLHEEGIINKSKVKKEKIDELVFAFSFEVEKKFFSSLLSTSSLFKDSNKIYLFTEGDELIWSINDKNRMNIDNMSITDKVVDFEMNEPFIMNIDNLRLIDFLGNEKIVFDITEDCSICMVTVEKDELTLRYVFSSFVDH